MKDDYFKDKWSFDKEYLRMVIAEGNRKLEKGSLSREERKSIKFDIETFNGFIMDNYESLEYSRKRVPKSIDRLKNYILRKMARQYKLLGEDLINWILDLAESEIFIDDFSQNMENTKLPLDEIADLTIKNYEKNSIKYLRYAREIILDDTVKQIQLVDSVGSHCHHDDITNKSYILYDIEEPTCLLSHEVQHAIERLLQYPTNILYCELGSILFELLFNDELYKAKGYLHEGDFAYRITDSVDFLDSLYDYFQIMLFFASKNFDVSTEEFLDAFLTIGEINPDLLEDYLREEIASDERVEDMNYLFSYLKAIEVREIMNLKNKKEEVLETYLKRRNFHFSKPKDEFRLYERYVGEMKQKVRKK